MLMDSPAKNGIGAYVGGSVVASLITFIISSIVLEHPLICLTIAGLYLAMMIVFPFVILLRNLTKLSSLTSREQFLIPFVPYFLTPLWIGCWIFISGWKEEVPILRYGGLGLMFVLCVLAFLSWIKLCDRPKPPVANAATTLPDEE